MGLKSVVNGGSTGSGESDGGSGGGGAGGCGSAAAPSLSLDDLSLTFTVGVVDSSGRPREHELFAGGSDVAVTKANFLSYLYRVADFKLNRQIAAQSRAFLRGFHDLIPVDWIRMFDARELQMLISGDDQGVRGE